MMGCMGLYLNSSTAGPLEQKQARFTKLEMFLNAFGVESDGCPYVQAHIDFTKKKATCHRWYDNPAFKESIYRLSPQAIDSLYLLLEQTDFTKLKRSYEQLATDQPTSTILLIRSNKDTITIKDYGLVGEYPLNLMYQLVYRLNL